MASQDEARRKEIVKEIESWRRSKLLPEQYCDFLQNLYLEDLNERPKGPLGAAVQSVAQASGKMWLLAISGFTLICLISLYFSALPTAMQLGLAAAAVALLFWMGGRARDRHPPKARLWAAGGMLLSFGSGYRILLLNDWGGESGELILLALCGLLWIVCGLAMRISLLHFFGWQALIVLYALLLVRYAPEPSWIEVQVYWIPAALLFGWLSWFMHVRGKRIGTVLFSTGLLLWFMPEVYSTLFGVDPTWIQTLLVVKIVLLGFVLFRLRRQWMEWVV